MSSQNSLRPIEILLVEDSPTDRLITTTALENSKLLNSLHVVENGVEAMSYLRREGKYADARRPDIVLLDLNLPKKDGREVLAEIKGDPRLKFIPVVVLTTSASKEDLLCAYSNHANSYITKPVDFERFNEALRALGTYWFEVVTLPSDIEVEAHLRPPPPRPMPTGPKPADSAIEVLLIEDSPTDAVLFRLALDASRSNFKLTHVSRIEEARSLLASQTFQLVVTDLGLPDSQGLDTYRKVRSYAGGLPIIVLTSLDNDTTGVDALQEGADDYLVKGELTPHALARAARYAIDKQHFRERRGQSERLEAIGRLAAGVAHDFNNILTIVRVNAELLEVAQGPQDVNDSAREIEEAADRAIALARQLLTFSRKQAMHTGPLNLNDVIGKFCKLHRRVLGDTVQLDLHLGADLPQVLADNAMVEQILLNLAVNARDAMPAGGKLKIQTTVIEITPGAQRMHASSYPGRFIQLTLADTGAGIEPASLGRIFEPFFTTKKAGEGTGLGLSTVYGIVQQHRGWIDVTSRLTVGTTFNVFLPAIRETPATPARATQDHPSRGTETILLVEDEHALQQLAAKVLRRNGYKVLTAGSVAEAMTVWGQQSDKIDLVLTDLTLPDGQTGRQLSERLLGMKPALKVIFTSGYSADFSAANFPLREGENFLQKPYSIANLLSIVRNYLDTTPPSVV